MSDRFFGAEPADNCFLAVRRSAINDKVSARATGLVSHHGAIGEGESLLM